MTDTHYQQLRLNFFHPPTQEQDNLLHHLDSFLFNQTGNQIFLLRGYAGTGKTSMISAIVKSLRHLRIPIVLMAPTGRAAKVLSAYSCYWSSTIHRRIYFALTDANGNLMLKLQPNKYRNAVFLIDEASMIANERTEEQSGGRILLDDLIEFVFSGENSKLFLVGDVAQLPPVGLNISPALNTIHLKNAYHFPVTKFELTEVVRQKKDSGILWNATRLRQIMISKNYQTPLLEIDGFQDIKRIDGYGLPEEIQNCYAQFGQDETTLITRSNKAAYQYNMAIRSRILYREHEIEAGDILMIVKNNYFWLDEKSNPGFLANGDLIEVVSIGAEKEAFGFRFVDLEVRLLDYPDRETVNFKVVLDSLQAEGPAMSQSQNNKLYQAVLDSYSYIGESKARKEKVRNDPFFNAVQIKYAYSMTGHKTQGGQWHTIFIDHGFIKTENIDLDYLRWLYTAITRATKQVFLINFPDDFFTSTQ